MVKGIETNRKIHINFGFVEIVLMNHSQAMVDWVLPSILSWRIVSVGDQMQTFWVQPPQKNKPYFMSLPFILLLCHIVIILISTPSNQKLVCQWWGQQSSQVGQSWKSNVGSFILTEVADQVCPLTQLLWLLQGDIARFDRKFSFHQGHNFKNDIYVTLYWYRSKCIYWMGLYDDLYLSLFILICEDLNLDSKECFRNLIQT